MSMDLKKLHLLGGVSCNSFIREKFANVARRHGLKMYFPDPKLCTDNAAMIASSGYYNFISGKKSDMTLNAVPNLKIGS